MIAHQWTWRTYAGGLGGIDQPEKVRGQIVWSTGLGYGQGNSPEMGLRLFHSRMPSLLSTSREKVGMLAMNYVADGERSQWVGALAVRRGDVTVSVYNDIVPGYFMDPRRDEYETGGGQVSILLRGWPGGIRTVNFGTEVYTDKPIIITDQDGKVRESIYQDPWDGKLYYNVYSPQLNAGWWFVTFSGESSNGYNWTGGLYALGGKPGMAFQNFIHKYISHDPFFKSPHPLGVGVMGGVGQTR